jgi:hypothetical protein
MAMPNRDSMDTGCRRLSPVEENAPEWEERHYCQEVHKFVKQTIAILFATYSSLCSVTGIFSFSVVGGTTAGVVGAHSATNIAKNMCQFRSLAS